MKNKLNNAKVFELQGLLEDFLDKISEVDSHITNKDILLLVKDLNDFILNNATYEPKDLDIVEVDGVLKYRKDLETPFEEYKLVQESEELVSDNVEEKVVQVTPVSEIFEKIAEEIQEKTTKENITKHEICIVPLPEDINKKSDIIQGVVVEPHQDIYLNELLEIPITSSKEICLVPPADSKETIECTIEAQKEVLVLTPHQQERFDGATKRIDEILNRSNSLYKINSAGDSVVNYMAVLEGAAGTGKTTMMTKILEHFADNRISVCFCSPTHQALGVIRDTLRKYELEFCESVQDLIYGDCKLIIKTLASFLGIKMKRDLENGKESFVEDKRAEKIMVDVLCIDESSMVSKDQLAIICAKLHICVKAILFIGDEIQLPSPSDKEPNKIFTLPYFAKFSLEEIVRQAADNKLLPLAWELRSYILNKQYPYKPSVLLHDGRMNENIIIYRNNQPGFIYHYGQDQAKLKLISTYTNRVCNEYNNFIRWEKLIGNCGEMENIKIEKTLELTSTQSAFPAAPVAVSTPPVEKEDRVRIYTQEEFREYYVGEKIIILETNQANGDVIHQNGEVITIQSVFNRVHSIFIETTTSDIFGQSQMEEFKLEYYEIIDTNFKRVNVIKFHQVELYHQIINLLSIETHKNTGKHKWKKFYDFKEKFTKVNYLFAATLYKLQGSTCENLYLDARDLDKFFIWNPDIVYRLIYVALTRPKNSIIILI